MDFKRTESTSLHDYYIRSNQFLLFLQSSSIRLKMFLLVGTIGLIGNILKLANTVLILIRGAMKGPFATPEHNRELFNLFTTVDQICIHHDWIRFNPFLFCSAFDDVWCSLALPTRHHIESQLRSIKRQFYLITLANGFLCYISLFHDPLMLRSASHSIYLGKLISLFGYTYSGLIYYHLMVTCVFLKTGYSTLARILTTLVNQQSNWARSHPLSTETILYCRNVYQKIGILTELTDQSHRLFIGIFYLSCLPKFVTILLDLTFTENIFNTFNATEAVVILIRLIVVTNTVSPIPECASSIRTVVYQLTLGPVSESAMLEISLFLERIKHQTHGIKLFSKKLISSNLIPTLIAAVFTYFIATASMGQNLTNAKSY